MPNPNIAATSFAYLIFALFAIFGPGLAVQRLLRLRLDHALVIPLGLVLCAASYWISVVTAAPWLFIAPILLIDVALLLPLGPWRLVAGPSLKGAVPPFLALVVVLCVTQFPMNRMNRDGSFRLDPSEAVDAMAHVGITWETTLGHPPQIPGLSGMRLDYHCGAYYVRGAAVRWAGVHPYDILNRFDPTLWSLMLILILRNAAFFMRMPPRAVLLAGWIPLASDFSFLLGPAHHSRWWPALTFGSLHENIFFANTLTPALVMALGSLFCLSHYRAFGGRGWIAAAMSLSLLCPFFKVFIAAPYLVGLGAAWLLSRKDRRLLAITALPCFLSAALLSVGHGGGAVSLRIAPLDVINHSRYLMALPPLHGWPLGAWTVYWLVASLGLRWLGIIPAVRMLRGGHAPSIAVGAMALSGWPIALSIRLAAERINEAIYFIEVSGPLLWLTALPVIAGIVGRSRRRLVTAFIFLSLTLPSTLEYYGRKAFIRPDLVPAPVMRAMRALEIASQSGDVVIMRPYSRYPPPPVVFIGRRVPFTGYLPYKRQFTASDRISERDRLVRRFFRSRTPEQALSIARRLNARFVYMTGAQKVDFDDRYVLDLIYEESGERVYRILDSAPPAGSETGNRVT
ncbi:MAG: hypothetical protein JXO72_13860 [Vicinamibacteria bacterium]|nr:hypothetical protein [Vicinamibacteria bacterium]